MITQPKFSAWGALEFETIRGYIRRIATEQPGLAGYFQVDILHATIQSSDAVCVTGISEIVDN